MRKPATVIVVLDIRTGERRINTTWETRAAMALTMGTCFGKGWSERAAQEHAEEQRQFHLAGGY